MNNKISVIYKDNDTNAINDTKNYDTQTLIDGYYEYSEIIKVVSDGLCAAINTDKGSVSELIQQFIKCAENSKKIEIIVYE